MRPCMQKIACKCEKNESFILALLIHKNGKNCLHKLNFSVVVVVLLFYVHGKHLRSCRDGQLT